MSEYILVGRRTKTPDGFTVITFPEFSLRLAVEESEGQVEPLPAELDPDVEIVVKLQPVHAKRGGGTSVITVYPAPPKVSVTYWYGFTCIRREES